MFEALIMCLFSIIIARLSRTVSHAKLFTEPTGS